MVVSENASVGVRVGVDVKSGVGRREKGCKPAGRSASVGVSISVGMGGLGANVGERAGVGARACANVAH